MIKIIKSKGKELLEKFSSFLRSKRAIENKIITEL
jgi:hypothetical protein